MDSNQQQGQQIPNEQGVSSPVTQEPVQAPVLESPVQEEVLNPGVLVQEQPIEEMQATVPMPLEGVSALQAGQGDGGVKKIVVFAVVLIFMIILGGVGYYYVSQMNKSSLPQSVVQRVVPSVATVPTQGVFSIDEEVQGVDLGNIDADLKDIDKDLGEL